MSSTRVLFLCTGNSARSQMAEAFLRSEGGGRFEALSAGLAPDGINPYTIRVMNEVGIDIEALGQTSKGLAPEFIEKQVFVDHLIAVCGHAETTCPSYPWAGIREFWDLEDPAAIEGTDEEKLEGFRRIRDQIHRRVLDFLDRT